jgi:cystathionine gamma-synthase/methionine-gamma-lyase
MTKNEHPDHWNIETRLVHSGRRQQATHSTGLPTVPPIYTSTTYQHKNFDALDQSFEGKNAEGEEAFVYARQGNPGVSAFEEAANQAEGGIGAVSFGSGMAAIHAAFLAAGIAPGAKVLASKDLFGPTINLLQKVFVPTGIELVLADLGGADAATKIEEEQPDIVFAETLSNPLVKLIDLDAIGVAAREAGAVTIIDNTIATPYLVRPLEHQFDLVVHSTTKYIGGHGDSMGGIVVSAHNVLLDQVRMYRTLLGAILSPLEASQQLRGLRTLSVRMERHCHNAMQVALFLQQHPAVEKVHYTGLPDHPQYILANQLFTPQQYGGLLSFELKEQSRSAVQKFIDNLQLCLHVTSLGDVFTLVSYPIIASHRTLTEAERLKLGITEGCIRVSVGIEHVEDIIKDLDQALNHI